MAEVTLETISAQLGALASDVGTLRSDVQARFNAIEARVIGLPIIGEAITVLQRDTRMRTAAVNDMARVNMTAGEAERLHTELERITAKQMELEGRILLIEQRSQR
jgi:hypothetical protein